MGTPKRCADGNVRTHFAGRAQQGQRQKIRGDDEQRASRMDAFCKYREVLDAAVRRRVLHQHAEDSGPRRIERGQRADLDLIPERQRARLHDSNRLRMTVLRDKETLALAARDGVAHVHRLGRGCGLVEQRRVRQRQRRQVRDHRLEVEQSLESALGDLGLVGRVLRVPARVLEDRALDDAGRVTT